MNETGATLSAAPTKLNKSGKFELSASAVHSTWTYVAKPVALCCTTQTCDMRWHRNTHSTSQGWQTLGTRTTSARPHVSAASVNESQVPPTQQLHLSRRGFPSQQVTKANRECESFALQTHYLFWSLLGEKEVMRTSARLVCEAEGSSEGTQLLNTKPEHHGWQFLFQSDASQVTN